MLKLRALELKDKEMVTSFLRRYPPAVSELTFTNLFVWRRSRPVFVAELNESLLFLANAAGSDGPGKVIFGPPVGDVSPAEVIEAMNGELAGFVRIPQQTADALQTAGIGAEADRDNFDYVYKVSDLAELKGRRFHKKRNLIKQCLDAYQCDYEPVTPALIEELALMQERWCRARPGDRDIGLCSEYIAIREAFDNFETLNLIGGAIRIDGLVQAYAIGEELSPGTAVCHFEKAMPQFRGLGQLVNHWFAKYALAEFEWVNREQDIGIPGLRQAKESYYPDHLVRKYTAWLVSPGAVAPAPVDPRECDKIWPGGD